MTTTTTQPVRKRITVAAPQAAAFEVFTTGMGTWWNPSHHVGDEALADVVVEPEVGGRWFERGEHGTECDWGRVLVWEPPGRVVFDWQLTADWVHDPDHHTALEIRFLPEGPTTTRVELEHRGLDAFGDRAGVVRDALDGPNGWTGLLDGYRATVSAVGAG
jgi:hypothetical protein